MIILLITLSVIGIFNSNFYLGPDLLNYTFTNIDICVNNKDIIYLPEIADVDIKILDGFIPLARARMLFIEWLDQFKSLNGISVLFKNTQLGLVIVGLSFIINLSILIYYLICLDIIYKYKNKTFILPNYLSFFLKN